MIIPKQENLTVVTKNVIPSLSQTPYLNIVIILAGGNPAVPTVEYTVSGKTITWKPASAGYDLEVGEIVTVSYDYDNGQSDNPFDPTNPAHNPVTANYNMTVITENIVPNMIHTPVAGSLIVKVNNVIKTEGVDWSLNERTITWISPTTLSVGDIVNVTYRVPR